MMADSSTDLTTDASDATSDDALVWANVYLTFSLTRQDRATLDAHLRSKDSSVSMRLRAALVETLSEAGVELPRSESAIHGQGHQRQ